MNAPLRRSRQFIATTCVLLVGLAGTAAAADVTITIAMRPDAGVGQGAGQKLIGAVAQAYEAAHPGVHIAYQPLTGDWTSKLTAEMAAGEAPDITEGWGAFAANWGEKGFLLDLNAFVKHDFNQADIEDFYPGQWAAMVVRQGPHAGERFGIPRYTNSDVMYFNKDLFEQAGLADPSALEAKGQWSWDSLLAAAKKLTKRDGNGQTTTWGYLGYRWQFWVSSAGGKVFDYPDHPSQFTMDSPKSVQGLTFLHDLAWVAQVAPTDRGPVAFAQGNVGIHDNYGSCCIGGVSDAVQQHFRFDLTRLPVGPYGDRHATVYNDMWSITAGTKHPKEAWDVLRFLTSTRGNELMTQSTGLQPSRISAIRAYAQVHPGFNTEAAVETAMSAYPSWDSVLAGSARVNDLINQAINDSVWSNAKSIKSAMEETAAAVAAQLAP